MKFLKRKMKNKCLLILNIALIIISIMMIYFSMREKVYCGTVTNMINAIEYNKHVSRPDPIMIVKFDVNGKKKEIHCSWITFTENSVGDRVCFKKKIMDMEPTWIDPGLLGLIGIAIFSFGVVRQVFR